MTLLDTNVLLWLFTGERSLKPQLVTAIDANAGNYLVSVVSLWEIAIKQQVGKLELRIDVSQAIDEAGFTVLSIEPCHIETYRLLPLHHRDPFDRMLVAQAQAERISIVSGDSLLSAYDVTVLKALR